MTNGVAKRSAVDANGALRQELIDGLTSYPIDSPYTAIVLQPKAGGYDVA